MGPDLVVFPPEAVEALLLGGEGRRRRARRQTYAVELDDLAGALGAGLLRETLERAAPAAPAIPEIVIASGAVKEARTS